MQFTIVNLLIEKRNTLSDLLLVLSLLLLRYRIILVLVCLELLLVVRELVLRLLTLLDNVLNLTHHVINRASLLWQLITGINLRIVQYLLVVQATQIGFLEIFSA